MSLIFPDGAISVTTPAGTEKIFAARQSDGKIVYFTGSQLFAALLQLKTINGESLIGTGNITIEGGGGGTDLIEPWAAGTYGANVPVRHLIWGTSYLFVSKEADNSDEPVLPTPPAWIQTDIYGAIMSWSGSFAFNKGSWVTGDANTKIYESKVDDNEGNTPSGGISNEYWKYIGNYIGYYVESTFNKGDVVIVAAQSDRIHVSNIADNEEPITSISSPGKWVLIGEELSEVFDLLDGKVDKVSGKSLIDDTEITRLSSVTNQDISGKADLIDGKLDPDQAIDADLSPDEFEQPVIDEVPQNIIIKKSWLDAYIDNRIALFVGDVLSAPTMSFGTSTDTQNVINWTAPTNATGYVLQVLIGATWTTIYTGALLTYTHTGLTASTEYDYQVKATADGYTDSDWGIGSKTTAAESGGEYTVERRISLDFQGEFGSDITGDPLGITWNTWKPTNAQIQVDGGAVKSSLVTEANVSTAIGVVNVGGWSGNTGGSGAATGTPPYPLAAINGGFTLQSTDVGIKFTGANPGKFYQVYVLSADSEANAALDITAGGTTINVVSTNNYPPNGTDRYAPTQLAKFYNIVPNGSGEFTISFHKTGSYYQVSVSLILIEESNIAKP